MEEVLSALASGAMGGGLAEWTGGLKGRVFKEKKKRTKMLQVSGVREEPRR